MTKKKKKKKKISKPLSGPRRNHVRGTNLVGVVLNHFAHKIARFNKHLEPAHNDFIKISKYNMCGDFCWGGVWAEEFSNKQVDQWREKWEWNSNAAHSLKSCQTTEKWATLENQRQKFNAQWITIRNAAQLIRINKQLIRTIGWREIETPRRVLKLQNFYKVNAL